MKILLSLLLIAAMTVAAQTKMEVPLIPMKDFFKNPDISPKTGLPEASVFPVDATNFIENKKKLKYYISSYTLDVLLLLPFRKFSDEIKTF